MTIYLVGETIDAKRAHQRAQAGELIQLVRGIYVDRDVDVDAAILGHAVRIANYLYPNAYLSSASAVLLAPTPDGRLFLSGRRNKRTRLRTLEIVQNEAPDQPSTAAAVIGDDLGELRIDVSSPRQRFLEAFRLRSEHASAITVEMRIQMAARLVEEHGTPQAAADAVWALARENGWYREGEGAERFLMAQPGTTKAPVNKAAFDLVVAWHGEPLGRLTHDGFEWRWKAQRRAGPVLVRETTPGKLPAFIVSLLPEGWLAQVLHEQDEREALRRGRRYMSNVTIVENRKELTDLPADVLATTLARFCEEGRFTGVYAGPARGEIEETFEQSLARIFARAETPRLSGIQIKAPMSLTSEGRLVPAIDHPFTHILKPAGTAGFETLPIVEWLCLELGRAAGFEVPDAALIDMPDGMSPALLVERFDIRQGAEDQRRLALEDFCSILDLPTSAKYDGTIERMARGLRPLSTDPAADLDILFRRAVFAWLIADGDMHLKNLAMLKTAKAGAKAFTSVRFAPLYDAVTTRVFPGLGVDRMALKLNGKDDRLTRQDFVALARTIGLTVGDAETAMSEIVDRLAKGVQALRLPAFASQSHAARCAQGKVSALIEARCVGLGEPAE
ncbi:type II toxin-antitoxin system HipA family toxin (plasmid) [Sphingomonas changnyeongensis]|uniref:Type II toxin-antitoxin system HipA family toxin n=1 Tax=Sphingomonas changnyeongensis TaxID=2698679 RepID=A0A7Z2S959_9SPHN|nr:HipA domain-containing protein [Sphingomonas changnyeongensis]QHL92026.1 type II toxin-antitoxin system HipA family toxin [Sphingomonas changnyeongensis]